MIIICKKIENNYRLIMACLLYSRRNNIYINVLLYIHILWKVAELWWIKKNHTQELSAQHEKLCIKCCLFTVLETSDSSVLLPDISTDWLPLSHQPLLPLLVLHKTRVR